LTGEQTDADPFLNVSNGKEPKMEVCHVQ